MPGLFETFLNLFRLGFEPFVLLLGLAGVGAAAALFLIIRNSGRRSLGWQLASPAQEVEQEQLQHRVLAGQTRHLTSHL